jgi:hypothetical protein
MFDTYVIGCPVATDKLISKYCFRLQLVIHSVLASRILFRLRSSDDQAYEMPTNMLSESMHFAVQSSNVRTTGSRNEV